ncbi:hypothetical protein D3C87_1790450 [compost metagenome]
MAVRKEAIFNCSLIEGTKISKFKKLGLEIFFILPLVPVPIFEIADFNFGVINE